MIHVHLFLGRFIIKHGHTDSITQSALSVFISVCFAVCVFFIENVFCSCLKEKLGALRVGGYDQPVGYIKVSLDIKILWPAFESKF
jgi:hypothetical protein